MSQYWVGIVTGLIAGTIVLIGGEIVKSKPRNKWDLLFGWLMYVLIGTAFILFGNFVLSGCLIP